MIGHHHQPLEENLHSNPQARGLQDYVRWFIHRFWILPITIVSGILIGHYVYTHTPHTYQSSATIEVLRIKKDDADVDEDEVLRMNGVAEMMSASEKLRMPALYTQVAKSYLFENRDDVFPDRFHLPWEKRQNPTREDISDVSLGNMMRGWVSVRWRPDTKLLDIHVTHTNPEVARDVLVALLSEYERMTESKVADSSEYALDYILENTNRIRKGILDLERAIELYNNCQDLITEIKLVESRIAGMEKRYLPKWPALVESKEHSKILKQRFSAELERVLRLSEEERQFWEDAGTSIADVEGEELATDQMQIVATRSRSLGRELESEQDIYNNLIAKLKEGNVTKNFAGKQFDIVQPASLPGGPIGPNKKSIMSKYTMGGVAVGVALILLMGFLDSTIRTVSELEGMTGKPVLGAIPDEKNPGEGVLVLNCKETPLQAEAVRTLRAGLTFLGTPESKRTFLITSSVPSEGKSWVASNLALAFAKQNERTLLIDGDLRRPRIHKIFGFDRDEAGLSDHLSLRTPLNKVVKPTDKSGKLYVLLAGSPSASPSELLASKALPALVDKLGKYFDRIIIDSAPIVSVSDTYPLAKIAQSVVLVCRMSMTSRSSIMRALRILKVNQSDPVGIVANGLPVAKTKTGHDYYYSYPGSGSYGSGKNSDTEKIKTTRVRVPLFQNLLNFGSKMKDHDFFSKKQKRPRRRNRRRPSRR